MSLDYAPNDSSTMGRCAFLARAANLTIDNPAMATICGTTVDKGTANDVRGLCQYRECRTEKSDKMCAFPFRFKGRLYDTCVKLGKEKPWCSTLTDADNNHMGAWEYCKEECSYNDCPVGFYRNYRDLTCYRVRLDPNC